jgi:NAD(P)H-hydrate epimerase
MQSQTKGEKESNNDINNYNPDNKIIPTRIGDITYLNSENAKKVDDLLMGENYKYSIDQLMEIAGLSVAKCIDNFLQENKNEKEKKRNKILVICGPGSKLKLFNIKIKIQLNDYYLLDNGGDGVVASRYLKEFDYDVEILYPKKTGNELYLRLLKQCENYEITIFNDFKDVDLLKYDLIIDGIFGFSFSGDVREPFKNIINVRKIFIILLKK